jgi:hypothetical protein
MQRHPYDARCAQGCVMKNLRGLTKRLRNEAASHKRSGRDPLPFYCKSILSNTPPILFYEALRHVPQSGHCLGHPSVRSGDNFQYIGKRSIVIRRLYEVVLMATTGLLYDHLVYPSFECLKLHCDHHRGPDRSSWEIFKPKQPGRWRYRDSHGRHNLFYWSPLERYPVLAFRRGNHIRRKRSHDQR